MSYLDYNGIEEGEDVAPPLEVDNYYQITLPMLRSPDRDTSWRVDAMCSLHPSISWFGGTRSNQNAAVAICQECTVSGQCLDFALRNKEEWGIWGGLFEDERKAILRERAKNVPVFDE